MLLYKRNTSKHKRWQADVPNVGARNCKNRKKQFPQSYL